jgi:hypothetical protein
MIPIHVRPIYLTPEVLVQVQSGRRRFGHGNGRRVLVQTGKNHLLAGITRDFAIAAVPIGKDVYCMTKRTNCIGRGSVVGAGDGTDVQAALGLCRDINLHAGPEW